MEVLVDVTPLDPVTGTRVTLRAASADDRRITGLNGVRWWPAVTKKPSLSHSFFDGDFTGTLATGAASLELAMYGLKRQDRNAPRYRYGGAAVNVYAADPGTAWPWPLVFTGVVDTFGNAAEKLTLACKVNVAPFSASALTATYAGSGGAEGGADLKGKVKPWALGAPRNVEPVLIDATNGVYQVSGYGPITGFDGVFEKGASFGPALADYANYAALVAATVPSGRWASCLAAGLFRLGAPAAGVITADVQGDASSGFPRRTGAILSRVLANAGVAGASIDAASLAALDAAVPRNVSLYLTEQTTLLELADALAKPCNAAAGVSWLGRLFITRMGIGAAAVTLDAQGRQKPAVIEATEDDVSPPYARIEMQGARNWRVQSSGEIAFYATIVPSGDYSATTTFREGNVVVDQRATWLYINPVATAGNAPPTLPTTGNAYWSLYTAPDALKLDDVAGASLPYRVRARGYYSTLPATNAYRPGLWRDDTGAQVAGNAGMWTVAYIDAPPASWAFATFNPRDNTGAGGGTDDAAAMAAYLASVRTNRPGNALVVYSYDDPFARMTAGLIAELCSNGASASRLTGPGVQRNGAYVLIANAGSPPGGGMDYYQGSANAGAGHSTDATLDVTFSLVAGRAILGGQTASTAADLSYPSGGTVDSLKPATPAADATAPVLATKGIQDGATRNVARGNWAFPINYAVGDIVLYGSPASSFTCLNAHTSDSAHPPPGNGNWMVSAQAGPAGSPGAPGAAGVHALAVVATPGAVTIACDAIGNPKPGQLPLAVKVVVKRATADITATTIFAVAPAGVTQYCTATDHGGGSFTLDTVSADDAYLEIDVAESGQAGLVGIAVTKVRDGSAAAQQLLRIAASASYSYPTPDSSTSITAPVGPNGTIRLSASLAYSLTSPVAGSSNTQRGQGFYRATPGSGAWTSFGGEVVGTPASQGANVGPGEPADPVAGTLSVNQTMAGPTAAANWEFAFLTRVGSSNCGATGAGTASVSFTP